MKKIIYILLIAVIACTQKQKVVDHNTRAHNLDRLSMKVNYSKEDSIKFNSFYDESRWLMYCIHCDSFPRWRSKYLGLKKIPFSSLELKLIEIRHIGDTVEFHCQFYYNDSIPCNVNTISNCYDILDGIGFNKRTNKRAYFIRGPASFNVKDPKSRYDKLLQPGLISYIRINKDKLNPWFYSEAKKRGIIE